MFLRLKIPTQHCSHGLNYNNGYLEHLSCTGPKCLHWHSLNAFIFQNQHIQHKHKHWTPVQHHKGSHQHTFHQTWLWLKVGTGQTAQVKILSLMPGWHQLEARVTCNKNSSQTDQSVFHSAKHSQMKPLRGDQWSSEVAGWPKKRKKMCSCFHLQTLELQSCSISK